MDGIETLQHMKETKHLCNDVPVIALTANAISGAREEYIAAGFTDYLTKPIDSHKLEAMLKHYLPPEKVQEVAPEDAETAEETSDAKELLTPEELSEVYEALKEVAATFDYDSAQFVLEDIAGKEAPESERDHFHAVCQAAKKPDWMALQNLLNE